MESGFHTSDSDSGGPGRDCHSGLQRSVGFLNMKVALSHTLYVRYRQIETFGRSTIRRFDANTSALKKLAARNYEDALQVC